MYKFFKKFFLAYEKGSVNPVEITGQKDEGFVLFQLCLQQYSAVYFFIRLKQV